MPGMIHLVRHAEGLHNLRNNPDIRDASLSQRGFDFAEDLGLRFIQAHSNSVGAVVSSPLRRTIQTSLTAFPRILSSAQYPENSGRGVRDGVMLALDADLQEITDLPCNTGSSLTDLVNEFPELGPNIQALDQNWYIKTGPDSPLPQSDSDRRIQILERLQQILAALQNSQKDKDILVVTHQGVISVLAPSANIPLAQWRSFNLFRNAAGQLSLQ
ncbi:Histidine phosphatase superfamily clade-1 [Penicillium expansum]|nr:Histidine phosphatase superfamily clade-1 [Penicillium expansum]